MDKEFLEEIKERVEQGDEFWENFLRRDTDEMLYDLKTPCEDCPFRKDVRFHEGIYDALKDYEEHIPKGNLIHTCHKTDKRADGYQENYKKDKPQHCAGLLIMLEKMGIPNTLMEYKEALNEKIEGLDMEAPVFNTLKEMRETYELMKPRYARKTFTTEGGVTVSMSFVRD